ncbi:MAG: methionine--tRNA ligase [Treponema sp.]
MKKLITSALPYVNNVPHLGNLIQVLSADVFARYSRLKGDEVLYICGTDEYGTATETKAQELGKTPRELCDYYHALHAKIYTWFGIAFDYFGRTSIEEHTEVTQEIFLELHKNGYIKEHESEQFFCPKCNRFLADRYIVGQCPSCGKEAKGDQCESCGKLLEPTELKEATCSTCHTKPILKKTKHLYIDLPAILPKYNEWLEETLKTSSWSNNAIQVTKGWIKEGLQERAITRDLKWGIPVPLEGYENKVFYVWFDAPIGYISLTKHFEKEIKEDWKSWWLDSPDVRLFQFIGKDNIPFHTVIFPSSLIGSGKNWTKLYRMSSSEYLNYEGGKFSKSRGTGVFGTDAMESDIASDIWRFYIFYNRPEKSDFQFTWKDFKERVNSELIGNLCNLVNRTLTFVGKSYDGNIPKSYELQGEEKEVILSIRNAVEESKKKIEDFQEHGQLKDAFHEAFALSDIGNKAFQAGEPWKNIKEKPEYASTLIRELCYLIKDILILVHPFIPFYASEVAGFLGLVIDSGDVFNGNCHRNIRKSSSLTWDDVGKREGLTKVEGNRIIFKMLDEKKIEEYRIKFSGKSSESTEVVSEGTKSKNKEEKKTSPVDTFLEKIVLKVARIMEVSRHPDADKLYILKVDDGRIQDRVIASGLVGFFSEEELINKVVVIADNLKPRKMRGIDSHGMLLAASYEKEDGTEVLELVSPSDSKVGERLTLKGYDAPSNEDVKMISADTFFSVPIKVVSGVVQIEDVPLLAGGKEIKLSVVLNGDVG